MIYHSEKEVRVFSKEFLLGDVPPLGLSFLEQPVQVQLYHTYDKYFRVFVQDDSLTAHPETPDFFVVDLQLCSPEQFKLFIELPHVHKDSHLLAAAVADLKAQKHALPETMRHERLKNISKNIYINSQDFYQVPRYIPSAEFLPRQPGSRSLEPPLSKQPNVADFLEALLATVIRCSARLGIAKFTDFAADTCVFARSWELFRALAVFVIKDEPQKKCFRLRCSLEMAAALKTTSDSSLSAEFTQGLLFKYSYIEKAFHARLECLDWDEKLVILKMVVDNIKIFQNEEKNLEFILGSIDQSKVNKDSQSLTVQSATPTAQKNFSFASEKTNYEIMLSLLEVSKVPIGVSARCKFRFPETLDERPVCLLISHPRRLN